jgi:hypothetical protein
MGVQHALKEGQKAHQALEDKPLLPKLMMMQLINGSWTSLKSICTRISFGLVN